MSEDIFNTIQNLLRTSWKSHGFARNRIEGLVRQKEFNEAVLERLIERGLINADKFKEMKFSEQNTELQKVVRQITYEYKAENIEIVLHNGVNFNFHAKVKPHSDGVYKKERQGEIKPKKTKLDKEAYYKALSLQIREYMRVNKLNQKQCAEVLGLSQARVRQILRYT